MLNPPPPHGFPKLNGTINPYNPVMITWISI